MSETGSDKIRTQLTSVYGGAAADWRRLKKFTNSDGQVERHFQNAKLAMTLAVTEGVGGALDIHPLANAPQPSPYCFAVQMMYDGQLDDNAHTVQVLLTKDWQKTHDNDWEPDEAEEAEIRALLPPGASHQGGGCWNWPGMTDPVETASQVAKPGQLPWRRDLQEAFGDDDDLTARISKRLAADKAEAAKANGPSPADVARNATVLQENLRVSRPFSFRKCG